MDVEQSDEDNIAGEREENTAEDRYGTGLCRRTNGRENNGTNRRRRRKPTRDERRITESRREIRNTGRIRTCKRRKGTTVTHGQLASKRGRDESVTRKPGTRKYVERRHQQGKHVK